MVSSIIPLGVAVGATNSATASAASALSSKNAADAAAGIATEQAAIAVAAVLGLPYFPILNASTAAGGGNILPQGITSGTVGGTVVTGATPGTYVLTPTGGDFTGVVANLIVPDATHASIQIVEPGRTASATPAAPTWAKPSSATLPGGTTLTANIGTQIAVSTEYYLTSDITGNLLLYWQNTGSGVPVAVLNAISAQVSVYIKGYIDRLSSSVQLNTAQLQFSAPFGPSISPTYANAGSPYTYTSDSPISVSGPLLYIDADVSAADRYRLFVLTRPSGTNFTVVNTYDIVLPLAGKNYGFNVSAWGQSVIAGTHYLGIKSLGTGVPKTRTTTGPKINYFQGTPSIGSTNTFTPNPNTELALAGGVSTATNQTVAQRIVSVEASAALNGGELGLLTYNVTTGAADLATASINTGSGVTYMRNDPVWYTGPVSQLNVVANGAGNYIFFIATKASNVFTPVASLSVMLNDGINLGVNVSGINFSVVLGQHYIGMYAVSPNTLKNRATVGQSEWFYVGLLGSGGNTFTQASSFEFLMSVNIAQPGQISTPRQLRSRYSNVSDTVGSVCRVGDSISEHYYATSEFRHDYEQLGIAMCGDVEPLIIPTVTDFVPGSNGLGWYGLSTSGTVSNVVSGPIGQALLMQPGASVSFTGNYAQVAYCYDQSPGAGTLTLTRAGSGAPIDAYSTAGTATLDAPRLPFATGYSGIDVYTLTASFAAVTLTSLARIGARASVPPVPHFQRMAYTGTGSTFWTSNARLTSTIKQATLGLTAAQSVPLFQVGIGTNDAFNTLGAATQPNVYAVNHDKILATLLACGSYVMALAIIRTNPSLVPTYIAGTTYDDYMAVQQASCERYGVPIMLEDDTDYAGTGQLFDGLHPNDIGYATRFHKEILFMNSNAMSLLSAQRERLGRANLSGIGAPNGVAYVIGGPMTFALGGSTYTDVSTGTMYVKDTLAWGNTGWRAL